MKRIKNLWAVVLAPTVEALERVHGISLLEIACTKFNDEKHVGRVVIGTRDEHVAVAARRLREYADLPERLLLPMPPDMSHRELAFHAADAFVDESQHRTRRWGEPDAIVSIDPLYPFSTYATVHGVSTGLKHRWASVAVMDVMPGLVMPIPSVMGHRYAPKGVRPHEDHEAWLRWAKSDWSVELVRVTAVGEAIHVGDKDMVGLADKIVRGRAFRFSLAMDYSECYVPQQGNTWAAFVPPDADFRFDPATDRREFCPSSMLSTKNAGSFATAAARHRGTNGGLPPLAV